MSSKFDPMYVYFPRWYNESHVIMHDAIVVIHYMIASASTLASDLRDLEGQSNYILNRYWSLQMDPGPQNVIPVRETNIIKKPGMMDTRKSIPVQSPSVEQTAFHCPQQDPAFQGNQTLTRINERMTKQRIQVLRSSSPKKDKPSQGIRDSYCSSEQSSRHATESSQLLRRHFMT